MTQRRTGRVARWKETLSETGEASWLVTESAGGCTAVVDVCSHTGRRVTIARTGDTNEDAIRAVEQRLTDVLPKLLAPEPQPAG